MSSNGDQIQGFAQEYLQLQDDDSYLKESRFCAEDSYYNFILSIALPCAGSFIFGALAVWLYYTSGWVELLPSSYTERYDQSTLRFIGMAVAVLVPGFFIGIYAYARQEVRQRKFVRLFRDDLRMNFLALEEAGFRAPKSGHIGSLNFLFRSLHENQILEIINDEDQPAEARTIVALNFGAYKGMLSCDPLAAFWYQEALREAINAHWFQTEKTRRSREE